MKKRQIHRKLSLRKDTLRTLGKDSMGKVAGGYSYFCPETETPTENEFCLATTLAQGCAEPPPDPEIPPSVQNCTFGCG